MKIRFGTSGWRDVIADGFTFDNVRKVAKAIATYLSSNHERPTVVVGYDTRFMAERFAEVVTEVLTADGIKVQLCDRPTPTPVISHVIMHERLSGGVNVTASHNPPEYSGIKFNPESGGPALPEVTKEIERLIEEINGKGDEISRLDLDEARAKGLLKTVDPRESYFAKLEKIIDFSAIRRSGMKVVADTMYGTSMGYLDEVIARHGVRVTVIHNFRDPYFGGDRPEPNARRLKEVAEKMKEVGADLGVATDGDADRFGVVDDEGEIVTPNEFIALVAEHLYEYKGLKGPVGRSIATSKAVEVVASEHGETCTVTPVGFKFLGPLAAEKGYVIVGEESGGLTIQNHVAEKDGILAGLLALEMIALQGKPLSRIRRAFREKYGTFYNERIDLELKSDDEKKAVLEKFERIEGDFAGMEVVETNRLDGYYYGFGEADSWLLARPSGTEPVVRVYIESKDADIFERLKEEVRKLV